MLDGLINGAKGYFPGCFIMFVVTAIVLQALYQVLMGGGGFDIMALVEFTVTVAVAGLIGSMIGGAAK